MTKPIAIKIDSSDRMFYDRYEYCVSFHLFELTALRELDHAAIDEILNHRIAWKSRTPNYGGSWRGRREITAVDRAACHAMCDYLLTKQDYKLIIYGDWGYIYTNDQTVLQEIPSLDFIANASVSIKQRVISRPRDTLVIRSAQHEYRSYFRAGRLDEPERSNLINYLKNQEEIRLSPGLKSFIDHSYKYINDNLFIDHNSMGEVIMLNLVRPRAIRKTVKLISDK